MNKETTEGLLKALKSYIKTCKAEDLYDAQKAINDFNEQWKTIENHYVDKNTNYGEALLQYSIAIWTASNKSEKQVQHLANLIYEYDENKNAKYDPYYCKDLFYSLGLCWHQLGKLYDIKVIEAFKNYLFHLFSQRNPFIFTAVTPIIAYSFRKCSKYLYQALINDELNLSAPSTFNDPFDCPIVDLLKSGNDLSSLMYQAFQGSLKIACFSNNKKLPYFSDSINSATNPVFGEKKHNNDRTEYLNELMWAHYADYHRGICIKYKFCLESTPRERKIVSFFRDVEYSNDKLAQYPSLEKMPLEDAFFLKGKAWEHENELRFLYYDVNGKGEHGSISTPGCIEAIYFGLKCPKEEKNTILNIIKDKNSNKNPRYENIKFFQIQIDKEHLGQLKAVPFQETDGNTPPKQ